jgi:hypothetical protein
MRGAQHSPRARANRAAFAWLVAAAVSACALTWLLAASGLARAPNTQKAAVALVARLEASSKRAHVESFAASKVVSRHGSSWFAYGTTAAGNPFLGGGAEPTRVRIYRWSGARWELSATVRGALGPSAWIYPESLTGSADPDFAIEGCGAGDTNCLSVVSDIGGRWHAVPFEYGYGTSLEVNGVPAGSVVDTEVDACSCAAGPTTTTTEAYRDGLFQPVFAPGQHPDCTAAKLTTVADPFFVQVLAFERTSCAGGWALAVGTGAGFSGPVVGLFARAPGGHGWQLVTLDEGTALPAVPAIYDVPLALLERLASPLGAELEPGVEAAKLIASLQARYRFYWPQQDGIVIAGGSDWLIAPVPAGHAPNGYSPYPAAAAIYRWSGKGWVLDARVAHLPEAMNIDWNGGWFVSVPAGAPNAVAFAVADSESKTTSVITNAGGRWHVASAR